MKPRRVGLIAALILVGLSAFLFLRSEIQDQTGNEQKHLAKLKQSTNPVVRDIAEGRFVDGSKMDELLDKHAPASLTRHGPYTDASFEDGALSVVVCAKDGIIRCAFSPGESHAFFCSYTETEQNERQRSFEKYRLNNCFLAVLGPVATTKEFPREWVRRETLRQQ